jgi:hypothetical protein
MKYVSTFFRNGNLILVIQNAKKKKPAPITRKDGKEI